MYLPPPLRSKQEGLGDVFCRLAPFLKLYSTYTAGFEDAMKLLTEWTSKEKRFDALVRDFAVSMEWREEQQDGGGRSEEGGRRGGGGREGRKDGGRREGEGEGREERRRKEGGRKGGETNIQFMRWEC